MNSLLTVALLHVFLRLTVAQDLCDRYGGGWLVWPEDKTRTVEHAVHWSKAQSKDKLYCSKLVTLICLYDFSEYSKYLDLRDG